MARRAGGNNLTRPGGAGQRVLPEELRRTDVLEAAMAGVAFAVIAALFLSGTVAVIVVVALAVRREDRRYSLTRDVPDRATIGVRRLTGVACRALVEFPPQSERARGNAEHAS
jgi:hypothetical protein